MAQTTHRRKSANVTLPKQRSKPTQSDLREHVVSALADGPETLANIRVAVQAASVTQSALPRTLRALVAEGTVLRVKRGVYCLAEPSTRPLTVPGSGAAPVAERTENLGDDRIDLSATDAKLRESVDAAVLRVLRSTVEPVPVLPHLPDEPVVTTQCSPESAASVAPKIPVQQMLSTPSQPATADRSTGKEGPAARPLAAVGQPVPPAQPWDANQRFLATAGILIAWLASAGAALLLFGTILGFVAAVILAIALAVCHHVFVKPHQIAGRAKRERQQRESARGMRRVSLGRTQRVS